MSYDIRLFTQSSIPCVVSQSGKCIPRLLASSFHGSKFNEVFHADLLYKCAANGCNLMYILVIKGDLSLYTWLHPCDNSDNDDEMTAIAKWTTCLAYVKWLVTNQCHIRGLSHAQLAFRRTDASSFLHSILPLGILSSPATLPRGDSDKPSSPVRFEATCCTMALYSWWNSERLQSVTGKR